MRIEAPPPPTPAAARILAAASELFYGGGITAVGVDRIAEAAGTTKKTIYDRYGSKEGLVVAYLRARHARYAAHVHDALDTAARERPDADPVLVAFDALAAWLGELDRGCGFINAYAELGGGAGGGGEHAGVEAIRAEKAWVEALFVDLVRTHHPRVADPAGLAARLAIVYEGAIVRSSAAADPRAAALARDTAALLLTSEGEGQGQGQDERR